MQANYKYNYNKPWFHISGQPNSICFNPENMNYYIADFAHQSIICKSNP